VGFDIVSWGLGGESDERKTGYDKCHSPFCDALDGPPTCWVPPCVSPSPIPPSSKYVPAHIPLERGGAGCGCCPFCASRVLMVEPTSLNRGEGLVTG
jgi:hypothetical protein